MNLRLVAALADSGRNTAALAQAKALAAAQFTGQVQRKFPVAVAAYQLGIVFAQAVIG